MLLIVPALAQDEGGSGPAEVKAESETSESVVSIPLDEETGTVDWREYLSLPNGGGANFGFITVLFPPDPAALADCPDILLDGAWYPPIPFSSGYTPPGAQQVGIRGWWYLEDGSGNLARRDMQITTSDDSWFASTWFMGGGWVYHIEEGCSSGYYTEESYLADEYSGPGIDYFLRSVWFRGVLGGDRMEQLLTICGAQRIGRDIVAGGHDRLLIFEIPANEVDRQNGRGTLLVWLTIGDWRLQRTRLHAAYAIEVTQFENVSADIDNKNDVFYSSYLPNDIYWSVDQYLLTHQTPFFTEPSPVSNTVPGSDNTPTESSIGSSDAEQPQGIGESGDTGGT